MKTLQLFSKDIEQIPAVTSWYLADLGEAKGKQELYRHQSPQKLKALREHALIESAVSSNRIEGVEIEHKRVGTVLFGKKLLKDRDEEEVRGYRRALEYVHSHGASLPVTEKTIRYLHNAIRGEIWDAGKYKEKESDIIERTPGGKERVQFRTVSVTETPKAMRDLIILWNEGLKEHRVHPLILLAAVNLDFLCIHPFRDGNGRVSRLLLLLAAYHFDYEVGRYISLERIIEQNKERYYETLELSSQGWHEGKHNPWHYINFILYILKQAYKEFEERIGRLHEQKGSKTERIISVLQHIDMPFTIDELRHKTPGVSVDMLRTVLKRLQGEGKVKCLKRGKNAVWRRTKKSIR